MTTIDERASLDQVPVVQMENDFLHVVVAPAIGGRVVSIRDKASDHEFLWRNPMLRLEPVAPGSPYDPNFYGGIDEVIPNDAPELVNGVASPDHGELWTAALDHRVEGDTLALVGKLPLCGLRYEKRLRLGTGSPTIEIEYEVENTAHERRAFMWKLHAALNVDRGGRIECKARSAEVMDPAWSRWGAAGAFGWPVVSGERADIIPAPDGTTDFLVLYDLERGQMGWRSRDGGLALTFSFDLRVFPFAVYFASYGGLDGHYVAVLEPCTVKPALVAEAVREGKCSALDPGEQLRTRVSIYAGRGDSEPE